MNSESTNPNSIPSLLRDLRDETTTLLRQEVALARTEMKENVSRMTGHVVHIAVGGLVAYAGIIVLLIGIGHLLGALFVRAGLDEKVAEWLAPAIVGLIVAMIGWIMLSKAKNAIAHDDLKPRQTIDSLRENKQWAQSKLPHSS
ncbi:MAG: phage holin family protein [Opitutaceae bacterium]